MSEQPKTAVVPEEDAASEAFMVWAWHGPSCFQHHRERVNMCLVSKDVREAVIKGNKVFDIQTSRKLLAYFTGGRYYNEQYDVEAPGRYIAHWCNSGQDIHTLGVCVTDCEPKSTVAAVLRAVLGNHRSLRSLELCQEGYSDSDEPESVNVAAYMCEQLGGDGPYTHTHTPGVVFEKLTHAHISAEFPLAFSKIDAKFPRARTLLLPCNSSDETTIEELRESNYMRNAFAHVKNMRVGDARVVFSNKGNAVSPVKKIDNLLIDFCEITSDDCVPQIAATELLCVRLGKDAHTSVAEIEKLIDAGQTKRIYIIFEDKQETQTVAHFFEKYSSRIHIATEDLEVWEGGGEETQTRTQAAVRKWAEKDTPPPPYPPGFESFFEEYARIKENSCLFFDNSTHTTHVPPVTVHGLTKTKQQHNTTHLHISESPLFILPDHNTISLFSLTLTPSPPFTVFRARARADRNASSIFENETPVDIEICARSAFEVHGVAREFTNLIDEHLDFFRRHVKRIRLHEPAAARALIEIFKQIHSEGGRLVGVLGGVETVIFESYTPREDIAKVLFLAGDSVKTIELGKRCEIDISETEMSEMRYRSETGETIDRNARTRDVRVVKLE